MPTVSLSAAEAAVVKEALAVAATFLSAAPRNLREEYEPHVMERLLFDRFDGGLSLDIAAVNVAGELASMDIKRLQKMQRRALRAAQ